MRMDIEKIRSYYCPIEATMDIIGGKYKVLIIYELINKTLRYSELQRLLPRATPRMLSRQLKELEADGVVRRVLYPVVPPKTEYSLTELGESLVPMILDLSDWGKNYFKMRGVPYPAPEENTETEEIT